MSLIIAYMGKKGCVMAADKRKVAYFGDKNELDILEGELYGGTIQSDDEFLKRAEELNVAIKITDGASKLLAIGDMMFNLANVSYANGISFIVSPIRLKDCL